VGEAFLNDRKNDEHGVAPSKSSPTMGIPVNSSIAGAQADRIRTKPRIHGLSLCGSCYTAIYAATAPSRPQ